MALPKMAILADLSSLAISCEGFKGVLSNIEKEYDITFVKFYSYVAKRNRDYNEFIAAKGYSAVTPISSKKRNKLDSRQIIDATEIALFKGFDAVALMVGSGDILPLISYLKLRGLSVYEIGLAESEYTSSYTGFIKVPESALREGYTAPVIKREAKVARPRPAKAEKQEEAQTTSRNNSSYMEEVMKILNRKK